MGTVQREGLGAGAGRWRHGLQYRAITTFAEAVSWWWGAPLE